MNNIQNIDKELEEAKLDLIEIRAYRALQSASFNFGTGIIYYDDIYGSEDAYYEMYEQNLKDYIEDLKYEKICIQPKKHKIRSNKYLRKKITLQKYKKLSKSLRHGCYGIYYSKKKQRYIRIYFSGRRKVIRKESEKKVRKTNDFKFKGSNFKKIHDFWYELF